MKIPSSLLLFVVTVSTIAIGVVSAFTTTTITTTPTTVTTNIHHPSSLSLLATNNNNNNNEYDSSISRKEWIQRTMVGSVALVAGTTTLLGINVEPAMARGRATLEKTYERYAPRIKAGSLFYANELRSLVAKDDWKGIKLALQEPPSRQDGDLSKPDAGVSARAAAAGGFSDARVLVAADLFAAAFSESSISAKTKKLQSLVVEERTIISEMQSVAKQALGEESTGGGLFGLGAKKPNPTELSKKMKELYTKGGNVWNQYLATANDNLALQFDRFDYIK